MSLKSTQGVHSISLENIARLCGKKKPDALTMADLYPLVGKTVFSPSSAWIIGKIELKDDMVVLKEFQAQSLATIMTGESIELLFRAPEVVSAYEIVFS